MNENKALAAQHKVRVVHIKKKPIWLTRNKRNNFIPESYEWCSENIGLQGYSWWVIGGEQMTFFCFERENDAMLFKLTFSE